MDIIRLELDVTLLLNDAVLSNSLQYMATPLQQGPCCSAIAMHANSSLRAPSVPQPLQPFQVPVKGRIQAPRCRGRRHLSPLPVSL